MNSNKLFLRAILVVMLIFFATDLLAADLGTWAVTGSMNTPRLVHTATLLPNGKVLVAGGETNAGVTASVEIYDSNAGKWTFTGSMSKPRVGHSATLLPNGKILVAGGHTGDIVSGTQSTAEIYDPNTGKWTATVDMNEPRCGHIATFISSGPLANKVLVAGAGCGGIGSQTAELYDLSTGKWSTTGRLLLARYWGPNDSAINFPNGRILVVGGAYDSSNGYVWPNEAELFDPVTQTWTVTNKTTNANGPTALLNNGLVLVAGGNKTPRSVASAELFNPMTEKWAATGSMSASRWDPSLTRLATGQVLVVGGENHGWGLCDGLSSAEAYDPSTGQWMSAGAMATGRSYHSATLLHNGKVLIAGGRDSRCTTVLSSAELYTPATPPISPPLISLGDIDADNSPEITVITYDAALKKSTAIVKNAKTGALVKQIHFNGQFEPQKGVPIPDLNDNGSPEIAVFGVRGSDQAMQVEVRDSLSDTQLSTVVFPSIGTFIDIGRVVNIDGSGKVALAVLHQSSTGLQVQLKEVLTGEEIRNIPLNANYNGVDLVVMTDLNGNKSREIAVLATHKKTNTAWVAIHDSQTGQLIRNINYGTGKAAQQLVNFPDLNNNGSSEFAVLRTDTRRVVFKDATTGSTVNALDYTVSQPFKLVNVADSTSDTHLALLGVRANGQITAEVRDGLTDTIVNKVVFDQYGTTVGFIAIPDVNGNGVAELVRLREQPGPQKLFAEVRDGRTGELIQGMYF